MVILKIRWILKILVPIRCKSFEILETLEYLAEMVLCCTFNLFNDFRTASWLHTQFWVLYMMFWLETSFGKLANNRYLLCRWALPKESLRMRVMVFLSSSPRWKPLFSHLLTVRVWSLNCLNDWLDLLFMLCRTWNNFIGLQTSLPLPACFHLSLPWVASTCSLCFTGSAGREGWSSPLTSPTVSALALYPTMPRKDTRVTGKVQ